MSRSSEEIAALVIAHLVDILSGRCSITRETIEQEQGDRSVCEILTGLLFLHEDLVFREAERARAEDDLRRMVAELEERNRELERSRAVIAELSNPVIRVWEGALMVPLIGAIDRDRAARLTERLLSAVVEARARCVILDLTGVETVDAGTADHLLRVIRAVELLGAQSIVAGVPPGVARAMAGLAVDLSGLVTASSVQEALASARADSLDEPRRRPGHAHGRR
jgi:rsbT co-antagonist protein RsbR